VVLNVRITGRGRLPGWRSPRGSPTPCGAESRQRRHWNSGGADDECAPRREGGAKRGSHVTWAGSCEVVWGCGFESPLRNRNLTRSPFTRVNRCRRSCNRWSARRKPRQTCAESGLLQIQSPMHVHCHTPRPTGSSLSTTMPASRPAARYLTQKASRCAGRDGKALNRRSPARPHLIVLDLMLPGERLSICRRLRAANDLTRSSCSRPRSKTWTASSARSRADDYLPKPFNPRSCWRHPRRAAPPTHARSTGCACPRSLDLTFGPFEIRSRTPPPVEGRRADPLTTAILELKALVRTRHRCRATKLAQLARGANSSLSIAASMCKFRACAR